MKSSSPLQIIRDLAQTPGVTISGEALRNILLQVEERIQRIAALSEIGVVEVNLLSGKRYWSKELRALLGVGEDEEVPTDQSSIAESIHPDDRVRVSHDMDTAVNERRPYRGEYRIIRKDNGEIRWIQVQADFDYDEQGRATRMMGLASDITARKTAEERLGYLANYDVLTGLPNRAYLMDRVEHAIALARRRDETVALLFVDLDKFKRINDTMGHDVGDKLLVAMADRLRCAVRDTDCVARIGGDEFVVLLSDACDAARAEMIATRIAEVARQPLEIDGRSLVVTCSVGISTFPNGGHDVESLLTKADVAMYQAKQGGRDQVCTYEDEMLLAATERVLLEEEIRRALDNNEFTLHYQPIISMQSKRLVGAEALIRWDHPEGLRQPDGFISVAEQSGMIVELGRWVMVEACRQAMEWQRDGHELSMSVNVSPKQIAHHDFVEDVRAALNRSGLRPEMLELEITETAFVADRTVTTAKIAELRKMGVKIAIDDFGTGYNSLANLRNCDIDTLKIDRSFIKDICANHSDKAIAAAILSAGKNLGIRVVAEGVETEAHYRALHALGCDDAQGYLFGRPLSPESFQLALGKSTAQDVA